MLTVIDPARKVVPSPTWWHRRSDEEPTITSLDVYDPVMCCTTGVCGPQVEPHLAQFEADLRWLSGHGATVVRRSLGQEPGAFARNDVVRTLLQSGGEPALPVILLDGRLRWAGHYPDRSELAAALGLAADPGVEQEGASPRCPPAEAASGCC